jgi:hypothetical protein
MRPEDDPEQRIRELERPLADVARSTELGTNEQSGASWSAYPPPPPPGPSQYQANFPGYPPTPYSSAGYSAGTSKGLRLGWIAFAVLVVGLAVGGGVIMMKNHSDTLGRGISGGGGSFTTATLRPSTERPTTPIDQTDPISPEAPAQPETGPVISVSGVGESKTIVCDESRVSISGVDNMVTVTGHCAHVEVSGMENNVTIESAGSITASGLNNRITYTTGDPEIGRSGFNNSIEHR